jgi:hypothetical protein
VTPAHLRKENQTVKHKLNQFKNQKSEKAKLFRRNFIIDKLHREMVIDEGWGFRDRNRIKGIGEF